MPVPAPDLPPPLSSQLKFYESGEAPHRNIDVMHGVLEELAREEAELGGGAAGGAAAAGGEGKKKKKGACGGDSGSEAAPLVSTPSSLRPPCHCRKEGEG